MIEFAGNEDRTIAGLLHDVIEDCREAHEPIIRAHSGHPVAEIAFARTDGTAKSKATHASLEAKPEDWMARKRAHSGHVERAHADVLLVSGCDKLHHARAIVQGLENPEGRVRVFGRFTRGGAKDTRRLSVAVEGLRSARSLEATAAYVHQHAVAESRVSLYL